VSPLRRTESAFRGRVRVALLYALLVASGFAAAHALYQVLRDREALQALWGGSGWLEAGFALSIALVILSLLRLRERTPGAWALRGAFCLLVLGATAHVFLLQPYRRLVAQLLAGGIGGAFAALVFAEPWIERLPRRLRSTLDLVLLNACVLLLAGEAGLRVWAAHSNSPLFAPDNAGAVQMIERFRSRPNSPTTGYPVNSMRFMDEEFTIGEPGKPSLVTIGDSFSASIVPLVFHFTSVAERDLHLPINNVGVSAIGPREYEYLLLHEVVPLKPAVVVVDIFIGNDLTAPLEEPLLETDPLRDWLDRERVLLLRVPRLLLEPGGIGAAGSGDEVVDDGGRAPTPAELQVKYPWLADPMLEVEGMTEGQYGRLEAHRAREACGQAPPAWPALFETLRRIRRACEKMGAGFAIMLIPDEFQVEEDVWARVLQDLPGERLDRDLPQRVLTGFCAEEGIPCLDLLPRLRAVPPLPDGRRHLYSLRDSHWNRRGNEVAGHALAEFLGPLLPTGSRPGG
jgi:hypothetical protein